MKVKSCELILIFFCLAGFNPAHSAFQQEGDGCAVNHMESLPDQNLMNSSVGDVVESMVGDACVQDHLSAEPFLYTEYCKCNKVVPTDEQKAEFEKFLKRRKALATALEMRKAKEVNSKENSLYLFSALKRFRDNHIGYPEACKEALSLEQNNYNTCISGEKIEELREISGEDLPTSILSKIGKDESIYKEDEFNILSFFGFANANGSLEINHTINPSIETVEVALKRSQAFNSTKHLLGPAFGGKLDRLELDAGELIEKSDIPAVGNELALSYQRELGRSTEENRLLRVSEAIFENGREELSEKIHDTAESFGGNPIRLMEDYQVIASYFGNPFFLTNYLMVLKEKIKAERNAGKPVEGKKITEILSADQMRDVFQETFNTMFLGLIGKYKELGEKCTDSKESFRTLCLQENFDDEEVSGNDFIKHGLSYNPKGTGVKVMCERAREYIITNSGGRDKSRELDEAGFREYLSQLGGAQQNSVGVESLAWNGTEVQPPAADERVAASELEQGSGDDQAENREQAAGPTPVPTPDSNQVGYDIFDGIENDPVVTSTGSGSGSSSGGSNSSSSSYIPNFKKKDKKRDLLLEAIVNNDNTKIEELTSGSYNSSNSSYDKTNVITSERSTDFLDQIENDLGENAVAESMIDNNFAMYGINDSLENMNANGSMSPYSQSNMFNAGNMPIRPVSYNEFSDEEQTKFGETLEDLDGSIAKGEKIAREKEKELLEDEKKDEEETELEKQLAELRKSIDDLKKQRLEILSSIKEERDNLEKENTKAMQRQPAAVPSPQPTRNYGFENRAAQVNTYSQKNETKSQNFENSTPVINSPVVSKPVSTVYGNSSVDTNVKNSVKKSAALKVGDAKNLDSIILQSTGSALSSDVFSTYSQENFEKYYQSHGNNPIVVKKEVEVEVNGKKKVQEILEYYFPEVVKGRIKYVKRKPQEVIAALRTVKSKKKLQAEIDVSKRIISKHQELVELFQRARN